MLFQASFPVYIRPYSLARGYLLRKTVSKVIKQDHWSVQESKKIQMNYFISSAVKAVTSAGKAMNNISTVIVCVA